MALDNVLARSDLHKSLIDTFDINGVDFDNMYMTSFLQEIIDTFDNIEPVFIHRGFIEIDNLRDLEMSL